MRKRTRSSSSAAKPKASRSPSPSAAAATAVPAPSLLTLLGFKPHVTFSIIGVLGLQLAFFFGGLSYVEFVVCGMRDNVDSMIDHPFNWALSANAYAQAQEDAAPDGRSLLVTSLLMADTLFVGSCAIVAMYLILCSDDLTVIAAMLCNHSIRALCFLLVELPKPERIIWRSPGFPDTENDYFFSGHIGLPIIAAMELWELGFKRTSLAFHATNVLQVFLFVSLQLHYTVDMVAGFFCGISCYYMMCGAPGEVVKNGLASMQVVGVAILSFDPSMLDFSRRRLMLIRGPMMAEEHALKLASAAGVAAGVLTMVAQL